MYRCLTIGCRNRFTQRGNYCTACTVEWELPNVASNVISFDGRSPEARRIADLEKRIEVLEGYVLEMARNQNTMVKLIGCTRVLDITW